MKVQVVGAGFYVPDRVITNERLVKAIPGWTADRIEKKTGIRERRFLWDFDDATGKAVPPATIDDPGPNVQVAEAALISALASAGIEASELDGLYVTTCSPDQLNFSRDALLIHRRLKMRPDAFALVSDVGCGGALFHLEMARELILGGRRKTIAVIGVNVTSPYLDRDVFTQEIEIEGRKVGAYLTMYLFGDGAGAIVLRASDAGEADIVSSVATNQQADLVVRRGGGAMWPPHPGRSRPSDHAYYVDGHLVARCFAPYMRAAVDSALAEAGVRLQDIKRFYLHQANKRLVEAFIAQLGISVDKTAMHMERYGNTSAAGTLILLAEDLLDGLVRIGGDDLILMAAIGAGSQCAAHVIRL